MIPVIGHEQGNNSKDLEGAIVGKLSHADMRGPSILSSQDIAAEILLHNLICSFCLTVALWVVTRRTARLDVETLEELGP